MRFEISIVLLFLLPFTFVFHNLSSFQKRETDFQVLKIASKKNLHKWQSDLETHIKSEKPAFHSNFLNPYPEITFDESTEHSHIVQELSISVLIHDPDHLNFIIRDKNELRWELPHSDPYPHSTNPQYLELEQSNFKFEFSQDPFNIIVIRKATDEIIFQLVDRFVFTDLFIEVSFLVPTNHIYGIGERIYSFQFSPGTYTLFTVDRSGEWENGTPGHNIQGHHPMYLMKEKSDYYHVFLFRNVNGQEITISEENKLTWRTIGGIVDMNFFLGDQNPEKAILKYHHYLGGWLIPPFWTLGHHHSKWGCNNFRELKKTMDAYQKRKIPIDSYWSDLDYMVSSINFSFDEKNFPLDMFREIFQRYKKRWVPIMDPWIPAQSISHAHTYPDFLDLITKRPNGDPLRSVSWSGTVYMLDFTHKNLPDFWEKMINYLNGIMELSAIWLDLNEITYLCNYFSDRTICDLASNKHRQYYNMPFQPGNDKMYNVYIVPLDSLHSDGTVEFNVRSMMSILEQKYSYDILRKNHTLPFTLSRGTMFGAGKYTFHWLADIRSHWVSLKFSVGTVLNYNLFGIPFVGPDICGFGGGIQTPPELCARWYQVGTFLPFLRNHHHPCEAFACSQEAFTYNGMYFDSIKQSIMLRYTFIKQYYTLYFLNMGSSLRIGTVCKPLFFVFHGDKNLQIYGDELHETEFMVGESVLVTPVLDAYLQERKVYFPKADWYDLRFYENMNSIGKYHRVKAEISDLVPHFLRGGYIILKQYVEGVLRTDDLDNNFYFMIGYDSFQKSDENVGKGTILYATTYNETEIYDECMQNNCLLNITSVFKNEDYGYSISIKFEKPKRNKDPLQEYTFDKIVLLGFNHLFKDPQRVAVDSGQAYCDFNVTTSSSLVIEFDKLEFKNDNYLFKIFV